jgi:hypothetical protein
MARNPRLIQVGAIIIDQGLVNLGQFVGFNFDSSFLLTDEGNLLGIQVNPAILSGSGEDVQAVRFSFDTPSPMSLGAVLSGQILNRAALLISTPFDDPSSFLQFGTSTSPNLIFGPSGAKPSMADQYEHIALVTFPIDDILQLVISPGASTQGAGLLLYKIKR